MICFSSVFARFFAPFLLAFLFFVFCGRCSQKKCRKKRARGPNYTTEESKLLNRLALKRVDLLECKKSDKVQWREKEAAWDEITIEFNRQMAAIGEQRTVSALKCFFSIVLSVRFSVFLMHFFRSLCQQVRDAESLKEKYQTSKRYIHPQRIGKSKKRTIQNG